MHVHVHSLHTYRTFFAAFAAFSFSSAVSDGPAASAAAAAASAAFLSPAFAAAPRPRPLIWSNATRRPHACSVGLLSCNTSAMALLRMPLMSSSFEC